MNRDLFLQRLREGLAGLPYDEIEDAMQFYREYFDEAGPQNESRVIEELGPPNALAAQIKADSAIRGMQAGRTTAKKGLSAIWVVFLAILASPIALPLSIGFTVAAFSLLVAALAVVGSLLIAGISVLAAGVGCIFVAARVVMTEPLNAMFLFGIGLISLGVSILVTVGVVQLSRFAFRGIARLLDNWLHKRRQRAASGGRQQTIYPGAYAYRYAAAGPAEVPPYFASRAPEESGKPDIVAPVQKVTPQGEAPATQPDETPTPAAQREPVLELPACGVGAAEEPHLETIDKKAPEEKPAPGIPEQKKRDDFDPRQE